ncbi:unnamed protein product [Schistocephalus solidus]|uniref:Outer capsid protein n=1 Tax=Schistocephalus solidus TaxID=70667 RepID=A0A183T7N2_SCHSO|nr:unnamed protein product [Schistocephalus solidus]
MTSEIIRSGKLEKFITSEGAIHVTHDTEVCLQVLFVSPSLNDAPKFEIIGKHGNISVQFIGTIADVDNEQITAENRTLANTTLNLNLCRMFVADMDSFPSLNDAPKFEIIGKHGNISVQFIGTIADVDNEQITAENRTLANTTLNLNLCRMFVADMDSLVPSISLQVAGASGATPGCTTTPDSDPTER